MKKLIRGILDFRKNVLPSRREAFARLAMGQAPDVLFITCSDSRIAPNWFASTDPGDLFVIRNVGNLVPPHDQCDHPTADVSVAAAIEFSLSILNVPDIIVCGHSGCGAMKMLAQGTPEGTSPFLRKWLTFVGEQSADGGSLGLLPDPRLSPEDQLSQANVLHQIENLKSYATVRERLASGNVNLHAWWFNIGQGSVYSFDRESQHFAMIDERIGEAILAEHRRSHRYQGASREYRF